MFSGQGLHLASGSMSCKSKNASRMFSDKETCEWCIRGYAAHSNIPSLLVSSTLAILLLCRASILTCLMVAPNASHFLSYLVYREPFSTSAMHSISHGSCNYTNASQRQTWVVVPYMVFFQRRELLSIPGKNTISPSKISCLCLA